VALPFNRLKGYRRVQAKRDGIVVSNIMPSFAVALNLKGMFALSGPDDV
jgi:hypothetical protein